jgi:translation initiation factor 1
LDILRELEKELELENAVAVQASRVRIRTESRKRGKTVTILWGFDPAADLASLAKGLKQRLGAGGTVKDGTIELQGDHRQEVKPLLVERGFKLA